MTQRRPHWDDELIEAVHGEMLRPVAGGIEGSRLRIYRIIAAVEDWQAGTTLIARADKAEAAIQRVRELHWPCCHPDVACITAPRQCKCGQAWPCDTIRALDGDGG